MDKEELARIITRKVVEALLGGRSIPVGVSNRHIHLCREDMDILFGKGSELTRMKDLLQPGQYACEETVILRSPKGRELKRVRVLGPLRHETQAEISVTDGFSLGISVPVRESGQLDGTPGIQIIGPCGALKKERGLIAALRHIHMSIEDAAAFEVKDKDVVSVSVGDEQRGTVFSKVLVRVSDKYRLELHLDVDEANAAGVRNGDRVSIYKG